MSGALDLARTAASFACPSSSVRLRRGSFLVRGLRTGGPGGGRVGSGVCVAARFRRLPGFTIAIEHLPRPGDRDFSIILELYIFKKIKRR